MDDDYYISSIKSDLQWPDDKYEPVANLLEETFTAINFSKDDQSMIEKLLVIGEEDECIDATTFAQRLLPWYKSKVEPPNNSQSPLRYSTGSRSCDESFGSHVEADVSYDSESSSPIQRELNSLKAENERLKAERYRLQTEVTRLNQLLAHADDMQNEDKQRLQYAEHQEQVANEKYLELKHKYESLEKSHEAVLESSETHSVLIDTLTQENKKHVEAIAALRRTVSSLEAKEMDFVSLKSDVESLQNHAEKLHKENKSKTKSLNESKEKRKALKYELQSKIEEIELLRQNIAALTDNEEKLMDAEIRNKMLTKQMEDLLTVLDVTQSRFPKLEEYDSDSNHFGNRDSTRSPSLRDELGEAFDNFYSLERSSSEEQIQAGNCYKDECLHEKVTRREELTATESKIEMLSKQVEELQAARDVTLPRFPSLEKLDSGNDHVEDPDSAKSPTPRDEREKALDNFCLREERVCGEETQAGKYCKEEYLQEITMLREEMMALKLYIEPLHKKNSMLNMTFAPSSLLLSNGRDNGIDTSYDECKGFETMSLPYKPERKVKVVKKISNTRPSSPGRALGWRFPWRVISLLFSYIAVAYYFFCSGLNLVNPRSHRCMEWGGWANFCGISCARPPI